MRARAQFAAWALLEAVERLVAGGFQPERTIYLAFGHDEETGGHDGAAADNTADRTLRCANVLALRRRAPRATDQARAASASSSSRAT